MPITYWIEPVTGVWGTVKGKRRVLAERREIVGHTQESLAEFLGVGTYDSGTLGTE